MDIIKTSIGITKTIKNMSRFKEILTVFSKNGFNEFIIKSGLNQIIPSFSLSQKKSISSEFHMGTEDWWKNLGERLRTSFEELGPSFIKFGQLLATREDLLEPELIAELKKLQNKVKPIPFAESKKIIQDNIGKDISEVFSEFNENPIGTASIGIVYKARLKTGERVVVKVRRPGIEKSLKTDFEIVLFIVAQMEKVSHDLKYLGMTSVLQDFYKATVQELNFKVEAQNCERLRSNLLEIDKEGVFSLPRVYKEFSTSEIMVMDFLEGKPFNEYKSLAELGQETIDHLQKSVGFFVHTLLADGFFHADLHGGNFFILPNGKIGLIDFGLMGTLSKKNRNNLIAILYALTTRNFDNLVYEFLDVAVYDEIPNHDELIRDLQDSLAPFIGLSVKETNATELLGQIVKTLARHRLFLPREWFIIFRALITLDGVGKSVGLDLNIFTILEEELPKLLKEVLSKESAQEELLWAGKDILSSLRIVPKHIKWFLKEISKNNYSLEFRIKNFDDLVRSHVSAMSFVAMSFFAGMLILCGSLFILNHSVVHLSQVPVISWIFYGLGGVIFVGGYFRR